MNLVVPLLAASAQGELSTWYKMGAGAREWAIILAALASVSLLALVWAVFFRRRRHLRAHRDSLNWNYPSVTARSEKENPPPKKRRKWRRRRREHRPRNPTLAETGGLPPARSDLPTDSSA